MAIRRREFFELGVGLVAGAALASCGGGGTPPEADKKPPEADKKAPSPTPSPSPSPSPMVLPHPELEERSIADLLAALAAKTETTASLVAKYRARIDACNERGPELRAVLVLDPDADAQAAVLDAERAAGKLRGPLHGIPILVKDNIDTAGKLPTTAGSRALAGTFATADAPLITRLRAAGALVLGKTNLSEWANLRGAGSSSGWSALGGQCRNPYALDRSPSGSSSGSAAATAASLCAAALGSETDGSITSPASCNALVGVKPTIGLVSRTGVIPISASQDTVGPLARTVADAAALLTAIAGPDPKDPVTTAPHPLRPAAPEYYARFLDPKALAGVRLGVPRAGFFGLSRHFDACIEAALKQLTALGAVLVDPVEIVVAPELAAAELEVLETELKAGMAAYLATRGPDTKPRTLADLIAFNTAQAETEMPRFGQELFEAAQTKGDLTSKVYLDARALCIRAARTEGLDKALAEHKLDAIIAGTSGTAWLIDPVNGDGGTPAFTQLPAIAGYPHVTVPAGAYLGLPMGLSFVGRPYSEAKLLAYAFAYEQATHLRTPPRFAASART